MLKLPFSKRGANKLSLPLIRTSLSMDACAHLLDSLGATIESWENRIADFGLPVSKDMKQIEDWNAWRIHNSAYRKPVPPEVWEEYYRPIVWVTVEDHGRHRHIIFTDIVCYDLEHECSPSTKQAGEVLQAYFRVKEATFGN